MLHWTSHESSVSVTERAIKVFCSCWLSKTTKVTSRRAGASSLISQMDFPEALCAPYARSCDPEITARHSWRQPAKWQSRLHKGRGLPLPNQLLRWRSHGQPEVQAATAVGFPLGRLSSSGLYF